MAFGKRGARDVRDPIIEPLWEGERLVVEIDAGEARAAATDVDGEAIELDIDVAAALVEALRAERAVIDAYVTPQATRTSEGAVVADIRAPTSSELAGQLLVGRARARRSELSDSVARFDREAPRALVAVDLLELDGESLLDVPLLERKRILESVVEEADLVRIGIYVRPPIDPWLGTWRALGFRSLAYKAANSRYLPGEANDGWAIAVIPQR
jgi:hypothetical protein